MVDIDKEDFKQINCGPFPSFMYPSDYFVKHFLVVPKCLMLPHMHGQLETYSCGFKRFTTNREAHQWLINRRSNILYRMKQNNINYI